MSAAASPSANGQPRSRRPWSPDGDDHLIFQWVKMEGKTQGWVASQLGISQATVSRIVQRYERWQAHAQERAGGRLDPSERLRAQRWLTFERNELILASCLRIAGEMEGFVDTSKSTIRRPLDNPNHESEVRTESSAIDRSGVAARFLRLAFRINMEQLKLAQLDQPPPAQPLSAEEIAEQERQAAADAEELAQARRRAAERSDETVREWDQQVERLRSVADAERLSLVRELAQQEQAQPDSGQHPDQQPRAKSETAAELHNVHDLHNENASEIGATAAEPCPCVPPSRAGKKSNPACITDHDKPPWSSQKPAAQARGSADDRPKGEKRRRATAAAR